MKTNTHPNGPAMVVRHVAATAASTAFYSRLRARVRAGHAAFAIYTIPFSNYLWTYQDRGEPPAEPRLGGDASPYLKYKSRS
ncbi:hypothetical protein OH491_13785 [Termitidicoccus mucosus]|uniref:Uncharacterized protein n=1 Tax=Termitidicoccus mucosus TaxID=1184151 RepID=A0A178IJA0_9BACT|nr:hypothetical protein AW736_13670 [Opitutaceae bacterium TSB47]